MPVLLLGLLAYFVFQSTTELVNKISFAPKDIDFKKQIFVLTITNPTETAVKINSITGYIYAGSKDIGIYTINKPFTIAAKNKTDLEVKINLDPIKVINNLSSILIAGKTPAINITGKINTSLGSFNFDNNLVTPLNLYAVNAKN